MTTLSPSEIPLLIASANATRGSIVQHAVQSDAERQLESHFGVSHALAVYGTLAPGRSNYRVVAPLGGEWTAGVVEGDLTPTGWGAALGYPAFRPRVGGPEVAVQVLRAHTLPNAWSRLDEFEGAEYQRILVPVWSSDAAGPRQLLTVANLYAAAPLASDGTSASPDDASSA